MTLAKVRFDDLVVWWILLSPIVDFHIFWDMISLISLCLEMNWHFERSFVLPSFFVTCNELEHWGVAFFLHDRPATLGRRYTLLERAKISVTRSGRTHSTLRW